MARPRKVQEGEVATMETPEQEKSIQDLQAEALSNEAIMNATNTEKQHKDVLLMNVKDLESHIKYLTARMVEMDIEYNSRKKLVDGINGSIAGAQGELSRLRAEFVKQNAKELELMAKKMAELESADKTVQALVVQNQNLLISNKQTESKLATERQVCISQVNAMKTALDQNQSEWNKREKDILDREQALNIEKEALEVATRELQPQLDKVSAVKNENILLLQEVERGQTNILNLMMGIESEKQVLAESKLTQDARLKQAELTNANQEKRLREWEQNLKDFDLEVRARSAKADKLLRTMQLEKEANAK